MRIDYIKCTDRDEMIAFLNKHGIETELQEAEYYKRTVLFKVNDVQFRIEWFTNESQLLIGIHDHAARIPFKYIYHDTSYPIAHASCLGFSYRRTELKSMFDSAFPWEVFRIPLEIKRG